MNRLYSKIEYTKKRMNELSIEIDELYKFIQKSQKENKQEYKKLEVNPKLLTYIKRRMTYIYSLPLTKESEIRLSELSNILDRINKE